MGTRVDQNIQTKNTWVHVLIRKNITRVLRTQTKDTWVHVLIRTLHVLI